MTDKEKILIEFSGYCYIRKPEISNDLNTLISNYSNDEKSDK